MSICIKCGRKPSCTCQLNPEGICSTCLTKEQVRLAKSNPPQVLEAGEDGCEYNKAILQIWDSKLKRVVKEESFSKIQLNGFQMNYFLTVLANALTMGARTGNYCFYESQLNPIREIIVEIGQKLKF